MAIQLEEDEYYFQLDGPEKLPVRWLSPEASAKWKFSLMSAEGFIKRIIFFNFCFLFHFETQEKIFGHSESQFGKFVP